MMTTSSHFFRYLLFLGQWGPSKVCRVGTRWMWNLICHHHVFSGISCFWGSGVHQKYSKWVLVGCGIKFRIQRVPTHHTFDGPHYPKNKKYLKKCDDDIIIMFFQEFLVFGVAGSIKSIQCGYLLDVELNSASNELSHLKFE